MELLLDISNCLHFHHQELRAFRREERAGKKYKNKRFCIDLSSINLYKTERCWGKDVLPSME
jgi:hypothetical protein